MASLKLVPAAEPSPVEKVRQRVRRMPKPPYMLQCNRCGGRELIEVKSGVCIVNGKPHGGEKRLLCATCLVKGERVVVA